MKEVIQGATLTIDTRFYNMDPSLGGVPTDPDSYLHTWDILNDVGGRVSAITFLHASVWPAATTYYFSIVDSGANFEVIAYSDAGRTVAIATTGALAYGVYVNQAITAIGGSGYGGAITITFPGIGGGIEDFEINDIGPTQPTYQIRDNDNTLVLLDTLYPTRVAAGHYQATYSVSSTATPGENWRIISRGRINNIDVYYTEYFRVIDATVATEEAAKLVTLSEVKLAMEITDTTKDVLLESMILPASQAVEEYLGQKYHVEDAVYIFDGNGLDRMYMDGDGPIYSITSLEIKSGTNLWEVLDATLYTNSASFITFTEGDVFEEGRCNYRLTYKFGVSRVPAQIRKATCELIKYWYAVKNRNGVLEDKVGGGIWSKYEEIQSDLPAGVRQLLNAYRKMA